MAELWARVADNDPITYYWEEPVEAREQSNGGSPEDSSRLFRGRRSLYKRSDPVPSADEELANVIGFLQRLQTTVRKAVTRTEAPSPTEVGLTVLQAKRLPRTGAPPDPFQIGVLPKAWSAPPPEAVPAPPPSTAATAATPAAALSAEPVRLKRWHAVWLVLTGVLSLAALGLVAFLWARTGLPARAAVTPKGAAEHGQPASARDEEPSEEALNAVNLTLEAMQHGDLKKASDLLAKIQKHGTGLRGFFYQAALLAFNQGRPEEADTFLAESIAVNEAVADCWYLRANTGFFNVGPAQAAEDFEQAAHAAPFNPRSYFFRAECLRRNGNTTAALGQFQQALRCRPSSSDTELILFKIGMTKLESSSDLIFKTELRDRLSREPVPGDTLLLGAADAISRSEYAEAAGDLKRAALVLPPRVFQSRVRDYVFRSQDKQPDIAAAMKSALPGSASGEPVRHAARVLVDPATRSLGEADPAGW